MSARLARAIIARLDGVFDDPDLLSFGALCDTDSDIRRFCAEAIEAEPPAPARVFIVHPNDEHWVGDWISRHMAETGYPTLDAAQASPMGMRWTIFEAEPETDSRGMPGWRLTAKP